MSDVQNETPEDNKKVPLAPTFGLPDYGPAPPGMPIPDWLNLALVILVISAGVTLLWCASHAAEWWQTGLAGVAFSYVMLTNYALLHEAAHGNLHSNPVMNYVLGVVTGIFFPAPFRLIRTTHQNHHNHNRSDFEMFDLYYPHDNRLLKYVQWYGLLMGFFWPVVPLSAVLLAIYPRFLETRFIKKLNPARGVNIAANITSSAATMLRIEVALIVATFLLMFWLLELHPLAVVWCYACFSFNWSTRQYVGHAFSNRDIVDGAWNLRHNRLMSWMLLHGEWDLNHHRRPDVPWLYLAKVQAPEEKRIGYIRQYWRQWLGPRLCEQDAPQPKTWQPPMRSAAKQPNVKSNSYLETNDA